MYDTYTCGGYIDSQRTECSLHYIYASDVEAAVYAVIQEQLKLAADMEEVVKDPADKHKLIIDPEAAAIVKEIFGYAIDGMRLVDIARRLNEKGYETPARYFQRKNLDKRNFHNTSDKDCWNHNSIRRILKQEMYYGAVVGHKREGIGVEWKQSVGVPKEEQVIVDGMHQGIVTKEEFLEAQKIFRKQGKTKCVVEKTYQLWRKVKCGTCGQAMTMKSGVVRGVDYRYFHCHHATVQVGEGGCTKECFREEALNAVVWNSVKGLLSAAGDAKKRIGKKQAVAEKNYTNNTKYILTDFEITFKEKADVTEEEKAQFCSDIENAYDINEEDMEEIRSRSISMYAETDRAIDPGESVSNVNCYYSGSFY